MGSTLPLTLARAVSRKGSRHRDNEDRFGLLDHRTDLVRRARRGVIYAVADGVSSSVGGDTAAEMAIELLHEFFTTHRPPTEELLLDLVETADAQVRMTTDAACTLTGVWLADGVASVFNLGDSATMMYRGGTLRRITPPQLRGRGLAAYVGMGDTVRHNIFVENIPFQKGDVFRVCSDGVLEAVTAEELHDLVNGKEEAGALFLAEVERRLESRGHTDDATMLVVQVLEVESA
jgi:serine/threonine protein phosphatase PrpC